MEPYDIYLFEDCNDPNNLFRYENIPGTLTEGYVYNINGGDGFNGYAKIIAYAEEGPIYSASGVVFVGGPTQCPTPTNTQTPTSSPTSTPTPTPSVTEELFMEPMLMSYSAPMGCLYSTFCFGTTLPSLSGYSGNYTSGSTFNDSPVYSGDGTSAGVIYYFTGASESYWCLSDTIGGTCYLRGSSPCTSDCPDISGNLFETGLCPTPTATAVNCSIFDFNAYFDCDYEPVPTPTPSVACDDVNFNVTTYGVTPTPSATSFTCASTAVDFSMSGYTPAVSPTVTLTPTLTLTKTVNIQGPRTFTMLDEVFSCVSVKVLVDCESGSEYYTSDTLIYEGIPIVIGMIMFASVNGINVCVTYDRDDTNISSNSNVDGIFNLYSDCEYCSTLPTPTPTVTSTPSNTPTKTPAVTPSNTPTKTPTPSPTREPGSTPVPTQSPTTTLTATPTQTTPTSCQEWRNDTESEIIITYTPCGSVTPVSNYAVATTSSVCAVFGSITVTSGGALTLIGSCILPPPSYVYVYESCSPLGNQIKNTQVIQRYNITNVLLNKVFQDYYNRCWKFIGRFEQNYIAPPTVITITNNGNYFSDANIIETYNDCATCQLPPLVNYYQLDLCEGTFATASTKIAPPDPTVAGQLYVLPGFVDGVYTNTKFRYTGVVNQFRYNPTNYNGSIQKATNGLTCGGTQQPTPPAPSPLPPVITCTLYENRETYDVSLVNYTTCAGDVIVGATLYGTDRGGGTGQTICAQDFTLSGDGAAYLSNSGSC